LNRERKTREERIREIWDGAKKAILEKGYEETTIEDIIAKTELSKGGFYHYYSSKKEILIDIIKTSNVMYMKYNDNIVKLKENLTIEEKKDILMDTILEKFLPVNDDKKLFTLFACEMPIEKEFSEIYLELEDSFFKWLAERLSVEVEENINEFKLISRVMSGLLFTQNIFDEPLVFQNNRESFKIFFEPIVDLILSRGLQ